MCFFGTLKFGLNCNSRGHQFVPRYLQSLRNFGFDARYSGATEASFRFVDKALGVDSIKRPAHFRFSRGLTQKCDA